MLSNGSSLAGGSPAISRSLNQGVGAGASAITLGSALRSSEADEGCIRGRVLVPTEEQQFSSSDRYADARSRVQLSLDNMHRAILSYIFEEDQSAYQTVAVELRKLLLDKNAPKSWDKSTKRQSLFELVYGRRDDIYVSGLPSDGSVSMFFHPEIMLACASSSDGLVTMKDWLAQRHVTSPDGLERTHETLLLDVADMEGAHILGSQGASRRSWKGFGIGLLTDHMTDFEKGEQLMEMWRQLVIFAGAKLLMSRRFMSGQPISLLDYDWPRDGNAGHDEIPDPTPINILLTSGVEMRANIYARPRFRGRQIVSIGG